jgi:hypothetical protein
MQLSDEIFRNIANSIAVVEEDAPMEDQVDAPGDGRDGRHDRRVQSSTQVAVYGWDEPIQHGSVRIRNLSSGGLGIYQSEPMALDQQVVVRLPTRKTAKPATTPDTPTDASAEPSSVLMLCGAVYWEPLAANLYAIGLQFRGQVSEAELAERQAAMVSEAAEAARESAVAAAGVLARIGHAVARSLRAAS